VCCKRSAIRCKRLVRNGGGRQRKHTPRTSSPSVFSLSFPKCKSSFSLSNCASEAFSTAPASEKTSWDGAEEVKGVQEGSAQTARRKEKTEERRASIPTISATSSILSRRIRCAEKKEPGGRRTRVPLDCKPEPPLPNCRRRLRVGRGLVVRPKGRGVEDERNVHRVPVPERSVRGERREIRRAVSNEGGET
jgi:hypothetical protein